MQQSRHTPLCAMLTLISVISESKDSCTNFKPLREKNHRISDNLESRLHDTHSCALLSELSCKPVIVRYTILVKTWNFISLSLYFPFQYVHREA